ncbi:kinetochore protein SPC25 homolog [Panicum virgatum]|nr:kinetochore protein SPC25 homolog [Panicum virgatum]
MGDSILNTTATNEQLRSLLMDQRATRDEYVNAISNQSQAVESIKAESDAKGDKNLDNAIMWYDKFLGFQVVGGEGVRFVFSKIDMQSPDKEYSFCIKLIDERYILVHCAPFVHGSEELVKDLNCNNDLYKFVRTMRERFQIATISGSRFRSIEHDKVL